MALQANFMDDKGNVDYDGMKQSADFQDYRTKTGMLKKMTLKNLEDNEMKALSLNLYNALMIHSIIEKGGKSDKVDFSFFGTMAYRIGPYAYTLDDLEHGILWGNSPHPSGRVVIPEGDPRLVNCVKDLD